MRLRSLGSGSILCLVEKMYSDLILTELMKYLCLSGSGAVSRRRHRRLKQTNKNGNDSAEGQKNGRRDGPRSVVPVVNRHPERCQRRGRRCFLIPMHAPSRPSPPSPARGCVISLLPLVCDNLAAGSWQSMVPTFRCPRASQNSRCTGRACHPCVSTGGETN